MKKLLSKLTRKNGTKSLKQELIRAHAIISLLSLGIITLLLLGASQSLYEPTLSLICSLLLVIIVATSVNTAVIMSRK